MSPGSNELNQLDIANRCTLVAAKLVDELFAGRDPRMPAALNKNELMTVLKVAALNGYELGLNDGFATSDQTLNQSFFQRLFGAFAKQKG
jgi:hypothetical protein